MKSLGLSQEGVLSTNICINIILTTTLASKSGLAGCSIDIGHGILAQSFMGRMYFLASTARNTLGFTFTASTRTPETEMGEGHSLLQVR